MSDVRLATPAAETRRRPSLVWLMPILAVAVAGYVVYRTLAEQGPLVTVVFPEAAGIRAETTELRIRDLRVGIVEEVGFTEDMRAVEARVRVDKSVAPFVDADAEFWLVEPQVSARGVAGLGTLLSGVYIAASWDGEAGAPADRFTALASPPLTTFGEVGTRVVLRARAGGQLAPGAPVLLSGIEVGRVGQPVLSDTGATVTMDAFIEAPHSERLTTNSRFWNASGISVNVGTGGLSLQVESLAALIEGGVNVATPVAGGEPIADGAVFEVFANEAAARADAFEADADAPVLASALLDADVSGLGVGTVVRFRGVEAGEVADITGLAPPQGEDGPVRLRVDMDLSPRRIGLRPGLDDAEVRSALAARVERGLRVRVASEGLFGQTVVLELVNLGDEAPNSPAALDSGPDGRLLLPTAPPAVSDGGDGVEGLVARVANLPIEDLLRSATEALQGVTDVTAEAQRVLAADGVDRIPATLDDTLAEVRALVAGIREGGAIESLNDALQSVEGTLGSVDEAAQSLPALAARLSEAVAGLQSVVAGYTPESRFYNEVRAVLNEVSATAEAFRSLARTIERNPSSILTGR